RARDAGLARHGGRMARRRGPTRPETEPRIVSSGAPSGPNRLEVAGQEFAVPFVFDLRANFPRHGRARSEASLSAVHRVSAGERDFSRSRQTSLNRPTAILRCHFRSAVVGLRAMDFLRRAIPSPTAWSGAGQI